MGDIYSNVSGAGGGGGCFAKGTRIQLQDGKSVAIESLSEGDEILSFDEKGATCVGRVTKVHFHAEPQPLLRVRFWRGMVEITPNHWVLNQYGNFAEMGALSKEDALVDGMGHLRPIIDAKRIDPAPVWNLTVEPYHTFIADDIRVHNGGHRDRYPVIAGAGGGDSGGKGGGGSAAAEDDDTLQSRAMIAIVDLLGEGVIGGLVDGAKSIFCNDTPLQNSDGSSNFSGVTWDVRYGDFDQTSMAGFTDVETAFNEGIQVKKLTPYTVTVANPNADAVSVVVAVPSLISQDKTSGDIHGSTVSFDIAVSTDNGPFVSQSAGLAWSTSMEGIGFEGDDLVVVGAPGATAVAADIFADFGGDNMVGTGTITFQPQYLDYTTGQYADFGEVKSLTFNESRADSISLHVETGLSRKIRLIVKSNDIVTKVSAYSGYGGDSGSGSQGYGDSASSSGDSSGGGDE